MPFDQALCLPIVIRHRIGARDETERERGGEREGGEEEHLERGHAEAGRLDRRRSRASFLTPAFTSSTQRLPIVTDRFQKAMIAPFIASGAWL